MADTDFFDALNWSEDKQRALLGHIILDGKFFSQVRGKIDPKWFVSANSKLVLEAILEHHAKFNRSPTTAELKEWREFVLEDKGVYLKILAHIETCIKLTSLFPLDALRSELTEWMRARIFHTAVEQAVPLFNGKNPLKAYSRMDEAIKLIRDANFEPDLERSFDDFEQQFEKQKLELDNALTWGLDCLDHILTPEATSGSLLLGDTTLLLAPTNVGKTTSMLTVVKHNIVRGKPSLVLTHEGRPDDIQNKIWRCFMGVTQGELIDMPSDPLGRQKMNFWLKFISQFLTFIPLNHPGLTVEDVIAIIEKKQEERINKKGSGYALVVDDYPAKLQTRDKRGWEKRQVDDYIYGQFVNSALENNYHSLVAIQTNREGSKINKYHKEERLLDTEDVSEAWGPITTATNVITANRDPASPRFYPMIYKICKSRSSETGWAVVAKTDFSHAQTHSNELGATYYQSSSSMVGKVESLLAKFNGKEVPRDEYVNAA